MIELITKSLAAVGCVIGTSINTWAFDSQWYHIIMCQLHTLIISQQSSPLAGRRSSLRNSASGMSGPLSSSLTTEQHYGIWAQVPQQKCVWVCYVQIYKELDSSYTVILCKLTTHIPNGLKLLKRETTFLLLITSFMPDSIYMVKFPKQQQHIWPWSGAASLVRNEWSAWPWQCHGVSSL